MFLMRQGTAWPLGLTFIDSQANFSLYAPEAHKVELVFFQNNRKVLSIVFDPKLNKTGSIWHIALPVQDVENLEYLFLLDDIHWALDPYAKFLNTSNKWGSGAKPLETKAVCKKKTYFDWNHSISPSLPLKDLVIYEMHTRAFTIQSTSMYPGSFLSIIEKIPYLKSLGINTLELMPIHEFNECENKIKGLYNFWGYSPLSYFSLMKRFSAKAESVLEEFKTLVKALHEEGFMVIIDVVYNHTAEGGASGFHYNLKDLDKTYYLIDSHGKSIDYTGCGNTLNANHFPAMDLVLESMRYLAIECHVDGFRFDLASTFYRDKNGACNQSKIVEAIISDPVLSQKILVAEAWDAAGLYQVGHFPSPFADWNGAYRDKVRSFLRNDPHSKGAFADALSGTCSLYFNKTPDKSINFITAHDGFSLHDLFSYSHKHNLANGEHNKDGSDHNLSTNCGHEGITHDPLILEKRRKLMRASYAILFMSLGTPMLLMGDEYAHTKEGNNNTWCHDNHLNHFQWDKIDPLMVSYIHKLSSLRKEISRLTVPQFYSKTEISWHNSELDDPRWEAHDGFLALHIHHCAFFIFNMSDEKKRVKIPSGTFMLRIDSTKKHQQDEKIHTPYVEIESQSVMILTKK